MPIALLVLVLLASVQTAAAKEVVVLLDSRIRPYVEALAGFKEHINANIKVFERKENADPADERALIPAIRARRPDLILAIGAEALTAIADDIRDIPIVFCMVLSPADKLQKPHVNITGIAMDIPPERQVEVLRTLLPGSRKVATIYTPDETASQIRAIGEALRAQGMVLEKEPATSDVEAMTQLEAMFDRNDAYWMVADRNMRSKDVLRYLYFASKQKKKALIGLSDKYVRAGALFAFSVNNSALGRQTAELSNRILAGTKPDRLPIQMPKRLELSINTKVAALLGARLPDGLRRRAEHLY